MAVGSPQKAPLMALGLPQRAPPMALGSPQMGQAPSVRLLQLGACLAQTICMEVGPQQESSATAGHLDPAYNMHILTLSLANVIPAWMKLLSYVTRKKHRLS